MIEKKEPLKFPRENKGFLNGCAPYKLQIVNPKSVSASGSASGKSNALQVD